MRADPGPVEVLLRLRDLAAGRAKAALARSLESLRAEEAALAECLAAAEAARRRAEEASRAPENGAGLRSAARFRERLRALASSLEGGARAQRARVEEASARVAGARGDLAGAEQRREPVAACLRGWQVARRAAREAAQEEERDGIALAAAAHRAGTGEPSAGRSGLCPARTREGGSAA